MLLLIHPPSLHATDLVVPLMRIHPALFLSAVLIAASHAASDEVLFNRDVRPLLSDRCFHCHGPDSAHREADLRIDTAEGATADLGGYMAIVPGKPEESELYKRIAAADPSERMPPEDEEDPLTKEEIAMLRQWIEQGAKYEAHWSFAPLTRPELPVARNAPAGWPAGPIDHFILRGYDESGKSLQPATRADPASLLRRASFDLTGLPPTPADVEAFQADQRPGAYERAVDRLLASPRFGERLAVYWLDLVRYADTVGYHGDQDHNATMYREYVIRSFNRGIPFDQFTKEQLAGDLLPSPTDSQLAASGYNRLLQTTHEGGAQDKEYLAKYAADRVRNVSTVWMGATMGCAECHNHKYDPYTQKDFYSMAAFFADLNEQGAYSAPNSVPTSRAPEQKLIAEPDAIALEVAIARTDELRQRKQDLESAENPDAASLEALDRELSILSDRRKRLEQAGAMQMVSQSREPRVMRVLPRGDWMDESGPIVEPAGPGFLPPVPGDGRRTRLDLANWLASRNQPQTARVLVNRLWRLFMGEGISRGVEDTGSQGEWPTHPDLLNYLAVELVDTHEWDLKPLIRQLVTSAVYQQSSTPSEKALRDDPNNLWWTRQQRFRLPAEAVRDQALLVSGLLVERIGGESAKPYQPKGYYAHLNFPVRTYRADQGAGQYRRGVYMHWQRQFLHPMLQAFDAPTREECTAARPRSNTPQAALVLLNDPTFVEAARRLAARALEEASDASDEQRINWLWNMAVSRSPDSVELPLCKQLLEQRRQRYRVDKEAAEELLSTGMSARGSDAESSELAAWTCVARALLSISEAVTRN